MTKCATWQLLGVVKVQTLHLAFIELDYYILYLLEMNMDTPICPGCQIWAWDHEFMCNC